ncbi:MAG: AAA family ATPase [Oscillospiraceae bacterium]
MAVAIIYGQSGAGKTVNSTLVKTGKRGKNLLLCSDNSHVVLKNFERKNLDIEVIEHWLDDNNNCFSSQFEKAVNSKRFDNIIVDNVSDLFDMAILEMEASGRFKDMRQAYQIVYMALKRLVRKAGQLDCNIIFTAWHITDEIMLTTGEMATRITPKLPMKILDNFLGLCNIIAYITIHEKDGEKKWYYIMEGKPTLYAKDQLYCRKTCLPENIFEEVKK